MASLPVLQAVNPPRRGKHRDSRRCWSCVRFARRLLSATAPRSGTGRPWPPSGFLLPGTRNSLLSPRRHPRTAVRRELRRGSRGSCPVSLGRPLRPLGRPATGQATVLFTRTETQGPRGIPLPFPRPAARWPDVSGDPRPRAPTPALARRCRTNSCVDTLDVSLNPGSRRTEDEQEPRSRRMQTCVTSPRGSAPSHLGPARRRSE